MTTKYSSNRDGLTITTGNRAPGSITTGNRAPVAKSVGGRAARARAAAKASRNVGYVGSDAETTQRLLDK